MDGRTGARRRVRVAAGAAAALVAALLVIVPALSTATVFPAHSVTPFVAGCAGTPVSNGITANVLWNGVNVCTHSSASSSLSVDFSQTADIRYFWNATAGSAVQLNDARLQMFYFGFALATRDVGAPSAETGGGFFDMSWTPGALTYVLEGLYGLTASLVAPNGTVLWSENFFVTAAAPYSILAVLPIVLLLIAIYEVYQLAVSGRQAALGRKPPAPPPSAPTEVAPPGGPTSETEPPASEEPSSPSEEGKT